MRYSTISPLFLFLAFFLFSGTGHAAETGTVRDRDGNSYPTVTIGSGSEFLRPQVWMKKNLNVAHYRNGDPIIHAATADEWQRCNMEQKGAWCYYENDESNGEVYGKLYNWYAVNDPRGIAPEGWHIPSDQEWITLERHLGMNLLEGLDRGYRGAKTGVGGKLKQATVQYWASPNTGATDESGFTALPGGYRFNYGTFLNEGFVAYFWTTTEIGSRSAFSRCLLSSHNVVSRYNNSKSYGFSVRCVKD